MSLTGAMNSSVSGMNAQSNWLSLIGDNISNSGTTGYKDASAQFETILADSSAIVAPDGGVATDVRYNIAQQGVIQGTNSTTDLAISGNGFFLVNDAAGSTYLTRAGSFVPDANGNLVNAAGYTLMGYSLQNGSSGVANGLTGLVPINITQTGLSASPSTKGTFAANLPSSAAVVAPADLPSAGGASYSEKTSLVAYDDLGTPVTLDVYMTNEGGGKWEVDVYNQADAASGGGFPYSAGPLATQTLTFDATTGDLASSSATSMTIAIPGASGTTINLDLSHMTQLDGSFAVADANVDGNPPSAFQQAQVGADGTVSFVYADGQSVPVYKIPIANVASPDDLTTLSGNVYSANNDSGQIVVGSANSEGFGKIESSSLETSTVDLAAELTNMIVAQHAYTANSKVFQTSAQLMTVLEQLVQNA